MMKWGRKKSSSIFHLSWFSKIKKTRNNFECEPDKGERDLGCKGMQMPVSWKNGRFYGGDDNSDWRLSFGEENCEVERGKAGGLKSVWYDSENENQEVGFLSRQSSRRDGVVEREEELKFNQMVLNIKKLREIPYCEGAKGRENREFSRLRRKSEKERKLRNKNGGDSGEKKLDYEKQSDKAEEVNLVLQEKDICELKPVKLTRATKGGKHRKGAFSTISNFETIEEDYMLEALNLDEERVKEMKLKELMAKSEYQRKSVYISTEPQRKTAKHSSKVRVYSPRTAYKIECKIKAIENMKRAKKKTEKHMREKPAEDRTAFNSFAVVKNSFDPQSDFKNSMIEMITVKGITKAEELEELLACYLTLNADVYHDTIIKVFRQVWFELIQDHLAPAIQN